MTTNLNRAQRRKLQAIAPKPKKVRVTWRIDLSGQQEIYSNVEHDTGDLYVFAVTSMRKFAEEYAGKCDEMRLARMDMNQPYIDQIYERRGIERPRLDRMTDEHRDVPIIGVTKKDSSFLIVDGNHRTIRRWEAGIRYVLAYNFSDPFWRYFILNNHLKPEFLEYLRNSVETESAIRDDCVSELTKDAVKSICHVD